ncbi:hypothetical protein C2G38_2027258 [Gigaspora rosea]|uniref:Uncharacterized protein n=1 Tax=Gigaspora rosea TaxID=44941 RepID=A0A397W990_9GLOM|nr:hypothetical protein C2G38_2027258 [Gigaspora rosea]
MGIYRSNKRRYQARQAAQKSLEKRQAVSHNKIITEIEALLLDLNQEQLDDIYKILTKLMNNETISNDISHDNETVSEPHHNWISTSTLHTWHHDVSNFHSTMQVSQIKQAPAFEIMVDESSRGETKNLVICYQAWNELKQIPIVVMTHLENILRCNSETVSSIVIKSIQSEGLDFMKCIVWTTDNTAYMSSNKKGAVSLFNKKAGTNTFRVGCGLHIMQIVLDHFEQEAFGILSTGFAQNLHPYNLLYLAWSLHDGYNASSKDKPLNINAEIIKNLYDKLLGYHYNQYQMPLRSHWGYELRTAKQYLDRYDAHKLYSVIKCMVNFAEHFYEPLIQFMVGQDPISRIIQNDKLIKLPPEAIDLLPSNEFEKLFDDLERGVNKAYEYFEKWMNSWLHLPLTICQLGGNHAQSFANSYRFVILKKPWIQLPTELELKYANNLEVDISNGNMNDFGLHKSLLHDTEFYQEFENFCTTKDSKLHEFSKLYSFVKTHIYFIVVHQQQVEGIFNLLDLKTHPNMSRISKESKIRLASTQIERENLNSGLEKIRSERIQQKTAVLQDIQQIQFGEEAASNLLNNLLK